MITGTVTPNLEAIVRLHVEDASGQTQAIDLKIDTAFTDFVSLPVAMIAALGLPLDTFEYVQIADGSFARVPVHTGVVIWDGRPRTVDFHALGKERLIGMALLAGHDLAIRVRDGGDISITLIP
jgi:predicted aspartyl protease